MARNSLYPASVQSGLPKLGNKPDGWFQTTYGDVLEQVQRPVKLDDAVEYQLITVKRNRGGVVERGRFKGQEIKTESQFYVATDDFLISRRQIIHGACGIVPSELNNAVVSNEYASLLPRENLLLGYLNYFSHTVYFQQTCFHSSVGVDVEKMIFRLDEWFKYPIYLPPLPEQRAIAAILSTWDEAITLTGRLIAALQQRKQALMQLLLTGKVRFEEFAGSEWEHHKLGSFFVERTETGFTHLPLVAITGNDGVVYRDTLDRRDTSSEDKSKYLRICPGDIGYNTMRMWQGVSGLSQIEGIVSPAYTICIPKETVDAEFMAYLFKLHATIHQLWRYSQGLVDDTLSLKFHNFSEVQVYTPDKAEQQRIADVLHVCDTEIELVNQYNTHLQTQKRGLMQQLLTGAMRVQGIER